MSDITTACMTTHADQRCNQRGIDVALVNLIHAFADMEMSANGGCRRLWLSRFRAIELIAEGIPVAEADAAQGLVLVVSPEDKVVTVYRSGPRDRRTRKSGRALHRSPRNRCERKQIRR